MSVFISDKARQKLFIAANMIPNDEVSGFGKTKLVEGGVLIEDIVIPPQEVGGAHVEIKAEMWQAFLADVINGKYSEDGSPGDPLEWRCWWHKHPGSTKPGPSGVDTNSLKWLAQDCGFGWMVGVIISAKAEQTYAWLNVGQPNSPWALTQADVSVVNLPNIDESLNEVVAAQMEHVKKQHSYGGGANSSSGSPTAHWHKDVDDRCECKYSGPISLRFDHRPGTAHRHHPKSSYCYGVSPRCLKEVGGSPQTPLLLTESRSGADGGTNRSTGGTDTGSRPETTPSGTDWSKVRGIKPYTYDASGKDTGMLEITYKSGSVLVCPDKGQLDEWVAWLRSTPETQPAAVPSHGGNKKPPAAVKKPGERAPKSVKNRIKDNIRKLSITPLFNVYNTAEVLEWNAGVDGVNYPLLVDMDNNVLLGFDDEGDPVIDLYDCDEQWVYYDINARAIDRSGVDGLSDTHLQDPTIRLVYLRAKYLVPEAIEDEEVADYVAAMFNVVDADDEGDDDDGSVSVEGRNEALTVDES